MKKLILLLVLFYSSCTLKEEKTFKMPSFDKEYINHPIGEKIFKNIAADLAVQNNENLISIACRDTLITLEIDDQFFQKKADPSYHKMIKYMKYLKDAKVPLSLLESFDPILKEAYFKINESDTLLISSRKVHFIDASVDYILHCDSTLILPFRGINAFCQGNSSYKDYNRDIIYKLLSSCGDENLLENYQ